MEHKTTRSKSRSDSLFPSQAPEQAFYRAQEFDHPHVLLQKETGYLKSMVQETGKAMMEALVDVAHQSYRNRASTTL